jgi:DNA-binding transcriptional LysR family regulator
MECLEDFLALAKSGNFSRAAEARSIAQPALSRHIRSLEEWMGVDLVNRSAHPATLTAAGVRFHPLLEEVLAALEAARIKARAAHDEETASLRFAVTHVLSLHFFPQWMGSWENSFPPGPMQTMSDSSQACEDMMLQRRVQFVMCYGHPDVRGRLDEGPFPVIELGTETLLPVCTPDAGGDPLYPLAGERPLALLSYSEASGLGRILSHRLPCVDATSALKTAQVVFTAHNGLLIKTMALKGKGIAWLPQRLVTEELQQGQLVLAGEAPWHIPVAIRLYRQPAEMTRAAETLWQLAGTRAPEGPNRPLAVRPRGAAPGTE